MAQINIGSNPDTNKNNISIPDSAPISSDSNNPNTDSTPTNINDASLDGGIVYNPEELQNPNKIKVTIADQDSPLVLLFGPKSCGKTMTVVRLTRYLHTKGFSVAPIPEFRPSHDTNYENLCGNFDSLIAQESAADATDRINFMLIKVSYQGRTLCQILEAPGEGYFNPNDITNNSFPKYVQDIINSHNRKIWCIILEPSGSNKTMPMEARKKYALKIKNLKSRISPRDRVVFVLNKIDLTDFVISPGNVKRNFAKKEVSDQYPGIFAPFINVNPITKLWHPYDFDFEVFQTGNFTDAGDGTIVYSEGPEEYPRNLWKLISKRLRG